MPRTSLERWQRLVEKTLDKDLKSVRGSIAESRPCQHPEQCIVTGRNQYGSWTRCLRCKTKLTYQPFSQRMDKVKAKGTTYVATETYQDTAARALELKKKEKADRPESSRSAPSAAASSAEMQEVLMQSNHQLLTGLTSVLSQAMTPLVQGQQTLLELTQQSMAGQTMMMQTVQQGQNYMAETMMAMSQQLRRSQDEEEWDQIPNHPPP